MSSVSIRTAEFRGSAPPLLVVVALGLLLVFVGVPFPLEQKAHAVLHGLCAQTPSHSLRFGDRLLPFDARMSGIYLGIVSTIVLLLSAGRRRAAGLPTGRAAAVLVMMVVAMALDGFNSLARDLGLTTPYMPDNRLRLATGLGAGVAMGTVLVMLLAMSVWTAPQVRRPVMQGIREPLLVYGLTVPVALLMLSGLPALYFFFAIALISASVVTLSSLTLVVVVMLRRMENSYRDLKDAERSGAFSVVVAVAIMLLLAGARFAVERFAGFTPQT